MRRQWFLNSIFPAGMPYTRVILLTMAGILLTLFIATIKNAIFFKRGNMGFFKTDQKKKLKKEYDKMTKQAMQLQRDGNIQKYSVLMTEAEEILKKIESLPPND